MPVSCKGRRKSAVWMAACAAVASLTLSTSSFATNYSWSQTTAGPFNWNNAGSQNNWGTGAGGAFPNQPGDVASILTNITATQTIHLNQAITLGVLNLGDTTLSSGNHSGYDLQPGTSGSLTFNNNAANAQLNIVGAPATASTGANAFGAPIYTTGDLHITSSADVTRTQTFTAPIASSAVAGTQTITFNGTGQGANYAIAAINNGTGTVNATFNTLTGTATLTGASDYTGVTQSRSGELALTGAGSILNTSGIYVRSGTLKLGAPGSAASSDRIGDTTLLRLNSGAVTFLGTDGTNTTERIGEIRLDTGFSPLQISNGSGASAALTAGAFSRDSTLAGTRANGLVYSAAVGNPLGGTSKLLLDAAAPAPALIGGDGSRVYNKKIVPYLMTQTGFVKDNRMNSLLTYSPASGFVPLDRTADFRNSIDAAQGNALTGYDNVRLAPPITGVVTNVPSGSRTINSLVYDNNIPNTNTFNSNIYQLNGNGVTPITLTVASGVIMVGSTNANATATRSRLGIGVDTLAFGAAEAQLMVGAANGTTTNFSELIINSNMTGTNGLTVSTIAPASRVILTGDNSGLSGPVTVNSGELHVTGLKALSSTTDARIRAGAVLRTETGVVSGTTLAIASVSGSGTMALALASTAINIGGTGAGGVAGSIRSVGGSISPGDAAAILANGDLAAHATGTLTFANISNTASQNLTLDLNAGTLNIDIDSTTAHDAIALTTAGSGTSTPSLVINGAAGTGMNLVVNLGFAPAPGDRFKIIDVAKLVKTAGMFVQGTTVLADFEGNRYTFAIDYNSAAPGLADGNDTVLEVTAVTAVPEPATAVALAGITALALTRRPPRPKRRRTSSANDQGPGGNEQ